MKAMHRRIDARNPREAAGLMAGEMGMPEPLETEWLAWAVDMTGIASHFHHGDLAQAQAMAM